MLLEDFKDVKYLGHIYTVSNLGKVYYNGIEMNQRYNADNYKVVSCKGNRSRAIHIFVAEAFLPKPITDKKLEVNHKDFNRSNNIVTNLEWLTHKENIIYSRKANRYPDIRGKNNPNYGNKKLSEIYKNNPEFSKEKQSRPRNKNGRCQKIELYKDGVFINTFDFIGECCEYLINNYDIKISIDGLRTGIYRSCLKNHPYYGFTFIYK